jgi:WhiB family transcriptional regulator, redox-sensing transcriptional regulator
VRIENIGYLKDFPEFEQEGSPLCSEVDPDLFFPVETLQPSTRNSEVYLQEKEVKAICSACPLRAGCAEYALKDLDIQGIWGGLTWTDRKRMVRRARTRIKLQVL